MTRQLARELLEAAAWVLPTVLVIAVADRPLSTVGVLLAGGWVGYRIRRRLCVRHERYAEQRGWDHGRAHQVQVDQTVGRQVRDVAGAGAVFVAHELAPGVQRAPSE